MSCWIHFFVIKILGEAGLVNNLRFVEVSIVDQHECQTYYGDYLFGGQICAEGNYNEGFCFVIYVDTINYFNY